MARWFVLRKDEVGYCTQSEFLMRVATILKGYKRIEIAYERKGRLLPFHDMRKKDKVKCKILMRLIGDGRPER